MKDKTQLIFTNKDVLKIWFIANLLIGLMAIVYCFIHESFEDFVELVYFSFIYGCTGLIVSFPSLFLLLIVNSFFRVYFQKVRQIYVFVCLILIINLLYCLFFMWFDDLRRNDFYGFLATTFSGLTSLFLIYFKKVKSIKL